MIRYIKAWHRTSAVALGTFLLIHMANRVVALGGQAQHIAFMAAVRPVYRNSVVEPLLLVLFIGQIVTGLILIIRGWRARAGFVAWLQAFLGIYLASFLMVHIAAVIMGRWSLGLDTDFRFAVAGFHVGGC